MRKRREEQPSDTLKKLQQIARKEARSKAPAPVQGIVGSAQLLAMQIEQLCNTVSMMAEGLGVQFGVQRRDVLEELMRRIRG
jgi:uncharacterized protein YunC (DUF1805 family)